MDGQAGEFSHGNNRVDGDRVWRSLGDIIMGDSQFQVKRVYDPPDPEDGARILVDGIWPRGLTKEAIHHDLWLKEVAPSAELRNWFRHDPELWDEFLKRYFAELQDKREIWNPLVERAQKGSVTLLYAARDKEHNNALALKLFLDKHGVS